MASPQNPPRPPRPSAEYSVVRGERVRVPAEEVPAPPRSMSPPPASQGVRVDVSEKEFNLKVRGGLGRKILPYLAPLLLSALGGIGGGVLGYFEGLKRAAARVAALELQVDAAKELLRQQSKDADRLFVVQRDHERRLDGIERQLKLDVVVAGPSR